MLNIMRDAWADRSAALEEIIRNIDDKRAIDYEWLVKTSLETIYNGYVGHYKGELSYPAKNGLNCEKLTLIDDGDYQGTLLFLIPFDTYQPSAADYLMTHVEYGSCCVCDPLEGILSNAERTPNDVQVKDLMELCKDIITNTIKPYNYGWRHSYAFDVATVEEK